MDYLMHTQMNANKNALPMGGRFMRFGFGEGWDAELGLKSYQVPFSTHSKTNKATKGFQLM